MGYEHDGIEESKRLRTALQNHSGDRDIQEILADVFDEAEVWVCTNCENWGYQRPVECGDCGSGFDAFEKRTGVPQ